MVGDADPFGIAHVGVPPAGILCDTPGPETVQVGLAPGTLVAVHEMVEVWPTRTRPGAAAMVMVGVPVQTPPEISAEVLHEPPEPVQLSVYVPGVPAVTEPPVAFPAENPPPVHVVALVDDQVSVEGTEFEGVAVSEHVG